MASSIPLIAISFYSISIQSWNTTYNFLSLDGVDQIVSYLTQ